MVLRDCSVSSPRLVASSPRGWLGSCSTTCWTRRYSRQGGGRDAMVIRYGLVPRHSMYAILHCPQITPM